MSDGIAGEKARIRGRILAARNGLPAAERSRHSRRIVVEILHTAAFRRADVVMAYSTFGSEVETATFVSAARACGKRIVLPRIERSRNCLALYQVDDEGGLGHGVWGIREPDPARCPPVSPGELDFILVPGVAFDRRGGRIGYGKGYYDRLLHACAEEGGRPWAVAGAFGVQLVESVPMEQHDFPIHAVVTEEQCIVIAGPRDARHAVRG